MKGSIYIHIICIVSCLTEVMGYGPTLLYSEPVLSHRSQAGRGVQWFLLPLPLLRFFPGPFLHLIDQRVCAKEESLTETEYNFIPIVH